MINKIKPLKKLVKEEVKQIVQEAKSQIIGTDFTENPDGVEENKRAKVEAEEKEQLEAARRRLKEITEELATARREISQEREEEQPLPVAQSLPPPEVASKSKSHMPSRIVGVEKRKRR